jgi:ACT domain-containing protein
MPTNMNELEIRKLAQEAVKQLGSAANAETVEQVVKSALQRMEVRTEEPVSVTQAAKPKNGTRVIITAFGKNHVGILAGLTEVLARHHCDILDLSQKLLHEFFTIMLLVDISETKVEFEKVKEAVVARGEELDLKVIVQHEEIFNAMHRV